MRTISVSSFLLFALLIVISPCESSSNVIEETCRKTNYYTLCVSTLTSDTRRLAGITLDILLPKANATMTHSIKLMEGDRPGSYLYEFYGTCVDAYGGSVTRLIPNALSELRARRFPEARNDSTQVGSHAVECEEQFGERNPLSRENNAVLSLATVAAHIIGSLR